MRNPKVKDVELIVSIESNHATSYVNNAGLYQTELMFNVDTSLLLSSEEVITEEYYNYLRHGVSMSEERITMLVNGFIDAINKEVILCKLANSVVIKKE